MTSTNTLRSALWFRLVGLALLLALPQAAEAKAYLGKITAVSGISVTIAIRKAGVLTFAVLPSARVTLDNKNAPLTALAVGEVVTVNSDDGVTATTVHGHSHQGLAGKITGLTMNSITIKPATGPWKTYAHSATTTTTVDGVASTVGDLRLGQTVTVQSIDGVSATEIAVKTREDYAGTISVVTPSLVSIMFAPSDGRTFAVSPATSVTVNGTASNAAALAVGQFATISSADGAAAVAIAVLPKPAKRK